jgi:hypothetical protein
MFLTWVNSSQGGDCCECDLSAHVLCAFMKCNSRRIKMGD